MKTKLKYNSKYVNNIKTIVLEHIKSNLKDYLIFSIIFIIGVMVGVVLINNAKLEEKTDICGYVNSFIEIIKQKQFEINRMELIKTSIIENMKMMIIIWIAGLTIIGIPLIYIIIFYKGICLGYTISAIILTLGIKNGIMFSFSALFLQNIVIVPIIFMLCVSALKSYRNLIGINKKLTIKQEIIRHTLFCAFLIIPIIVATLIETYISTGLICLYS